MSVDLQSKGAAFRRALLDDMQTMVIRLLNGVSATVAAQQDGTAVSDQHRTLNFSGNGVTVSDEPSMRRVNVFIPGSQTSAYVVTVNSVASTGKVFQLATSSTVPPTNWQTSGFNDTAWAAPVAESVQIRTPFSGSAWIAETNGTRPAGEQFLHRRAFTLSTSSVISAELSIWADNYLMEVFLNGTSVYAPGTSIKWEGAGFGADSTRPASVVNIDPTLFNASGSNVLAMRVQNGASGVGLSVDFQLTINGASISIAEFPYAIIEDQKTQNTAGGTFTTGAWQTRTLNTIVRDASSIISSLASNQFTLAAGTYRVSAICPAWRVGRHQCRLQNITDSTTTRIGQPAVSATGDNTSNTSVLKGEFAITASKTFEVQHRCETTATTEGFGGAGNFTTEVYTILEVWKVA